jgi:hypothetical protein
MPARLTATAITIQIAAPISTLRVLAGVDGTASNDIVPTGFSGIQVHIK